MTLRVEGAPLSLGEASKLWAERRAFYGRQLNAISTESVPGVSREERVEDIIRQLKRDYKVLYKCADPLKAAFLQPFKQRLIEALWIHTIVTHRSELNELWSPNKGNVPIHDRVESLRGRVATNYKGLVRNDQLQRLFVLHFQNFLTELGWHQKIIAYTEELKQLSAEVGTAPDEMSLDLDSLIDKTADFVRRLANDRETLSRGDDFFGDIDMINQHFNDLETQVLYLSDVLGSHSLDESTRSIGAEELF